MRTMNADLPHFLGDRRERFQAVRRRVFAEMRAMTSRWKLLVTIPFHALVLAILATHGFPKDRLAIQLGTSLVVVGAMVVADRAGDRLLRKLLMFCGLAMIVAIANTGGLASPLVLSLIPFFTGITMNPELENSRRHFVVKFTLFFGIMAWFSQKLALSTPLALTNGNESLFFVTPAYVTIAFASAVTSLVAVYSMGKAMTGAYERITLELAERREELCDENEGRTRALEGIAARLAHEVKNPLAAIKGLSTHMARSLKDDAQVSADQIAKMKERLTIVAAEAERLQEIVDGFLSFSRGLDELTVGPTKPYDIARELALLLETRAADAGVTIEVRGSREVLLSADSKKLRQAFLNLVLNAMQASSKGTTVTLEVAKICGDGAAVVRIMDRGAGMTPDILDRIRKPYFTTKEGGSGLGIAIARGIIEQHGGTLRFESSSGRGTTAIVLLPASPCARLSLPNPCRMAAEAAKKVQQAPELQEPMKV
jgi:signal transduction histidine kinase